MTNTPTHRPVFLALLLLLSVVSHSETIQLSQDPGNQALFSNMKSTFQEASKQTSSLDSLFNSDSFFSNAPSKPNTTKGSNVI